MSERLTAVWHHVALPIIEVWATMNALPVPVALAAVYLGLAAAAAVCERTNQ